MTRYDVLYRVEKKSTMHAFSVEFLYLADTLWLAMVRVLY